MKVFKSIHTNGSVSHHNNVKQALKSNPQVIFEQRGLIVNTH